MSSSLKIYTKEVIIAKEAEMSREAQQHQQNIVLPATQEDEEQGHIIVVELATHGRLQLKPASSSTFSEDKGSGRHKNIHKTDTTQIVAPSHSSPFSRVFQRHNESDTQRRRSSGSLSNRRHGWFRNASGCCALGLIAVLLVIVIVSMIGKPA